MRAPAELLRSQRVAVLAIAALAVLLTACGATQAPDDTAPAEGAAEQVPPGDEQAQAEPSDEAEPDVADGDVAEVPEPALTLVATVAPVADLVRMVGGDRVEVRTLVPAGADSHTYEPRPGDVVGLAEADAYLGIGLDLNDGALRLAEENLPPEAPLVRLGEVALPEDALVLDHGHDLGHTHGGDEGHTHGGDEGHTHGGDGEEGGELGPNPHVWTSVRNAQHLLEGIEQVLTELDPEGAETYAANAEAAIAELDELDTTIRDATLTIPTANRTLVTYHDAWTYFARDYDLEFATAVQPADYSDPSAAEVRAVIDLIRDLGVPAVFGSELFPTPVLETIAEETGASYVGDLDDDVLPGEPGDPEHTYVALMRRNAATIVAGLGGDASELDG